MKTNADDRPMSPSEESQSEDDEDAWMLTEELEKEFYKTLSNIKNKDPKIYTKDVKFFKDVPAKDGKPKKPKTSTLSLRDYERKLLLEKGGELSDEEPTQNNRNSFSSKEPTYVEEQEELKKSLNAAIQTDSESDDEKTEEWGGLFKKREKTKVDKKKEEDWYKDWLKGQKESTSDEKVEKDMKPLRDYWTNPDLDQDEQFLRDYVLNKQYLNQDENKEAEGNEILIDDAEILTDDKISHRFEEPDQEFIKRYPRVMENSVRRKNDHRKLKREEVKQRKLKEKVKRRAEIKHKQKLKKKEIEDKLEELKKLTGNDKLAFENLLNADFDIEEHDKAMDKMFSDEFYSQVDPNFYPGDQEEDGEEAWNENQEKWYEENEETVMDDSVPHCEDPQFNMDCDYDPSQEKPKEKISRSRRKKDKHRRTTVSEAVSREKPKFDPETHKSFQEYVDQYYAIDCEDFIGDLPCRFKYRQTVPNAFGLTLEEILAADDKELERWCSIKRIRQLRPDYKEKCDAKVYWKKASDEQLKRKILPSLFKTPDDPVEEEITETGESEKEKEEDPVTSEQKKKKKKKKKKKCSLSDKAQNESEKLHLKNEPSGTKSQKRKSEQSENIFNNKKIKLTSNENVLKIPDDQSNNLEKKKKPKQKQENFNGSVTPNRSNKTKQPVQNKSKSKLKRDHKNKITAFHSHQEKPSEDSTLSKLSDARLLAYGIKPKKFRNKLKYNKIKT